MGQIFRKNGSGVVAVDVSSGMRGRDNQQINKCFRKCKFANQMSESAAGEQCNEEAKRREQQSNSRLQLNCKTSNNVKITITDVNALTTMTMCKVLPINQLLIYL